MLANHILESRFNIEDPLGGMKMGCPTGDDWEEEYKGARAIMISCQLFAVEKV